MAGTQREGREAWPFWRRYPNFAQPRLGAEVVSVSDDFFGAVDRLLKPEEPVFRPDVYDDHGKWMDGWESRRRRDGGHDDCVVRLGCPIRVRGVDIDTRHFDGNQPESAAIEAASEAEPEAARWFELLPKTRLGPNARHPIEVDSDRLVRLLRLHIYPDGGIARLRIHGEARLERSRLEADARDGLVDLAAALHGGSVVAASDEHFGAAAHLLLPGRGLHMGDGWETRRRRGPGHDWAILELGHPGPIERLVIDTAHFKGNYPASAVVRATLVERLDDRAVAESERWPELLPSQPLAPDTEHELDVRSAGLGPISHVRLEIHPDGGVSRLRVLGRPVEP